MGASQYYELARGLILRSAGMLYLVRPNLNPYDDLLNYLLMCPDDMVPTVVEAMSNVCNNDHLAYRTGIHNASVFDAMLNAILREHRISYELVGTEMIEFSSRELHQEVTLPTLQLLAGRPDLSKVESASGMHSMRFRRATRRTL